MTRLVRMNEVQYVETDYDIERLLSEGFEVDELEETNESDEANENDEEKSKRGGRKKAEA